MLRALALLAAIVCAGCARGGTDDLRDGGGALMDVVSSDVGPRDAPGSDGALPPVDGAIERDGGRDGGVIAGDAGRDGGGSSGSDLDPGLDVPPASNPPCTTPGASCPSIAVCRFWSSTEGRCESCVECGNLFAPCASGEDCDILFVCYLGQCTNFCTLGTYECGPIEDCIDIGHPTRGACRPGF